MELTHRLDGTVDLDGYETDESFDKTLAGIELLAMETLTIRRETPTAWEVWNFQGPGTGLTVEAIGEPQTREPLTEGTVLDAPVVPAQPLSHPPAVTAEDVPDTFDMVDIDEDDDYVPVDVGMVTHDDIPRGELPPGVKPSQADLHGERLETETRSKRHAIIKVNRGPNKKVIRIFAAVGVVLVGFVVYAATRPQPVPEATETICLDTRTAFQSDEAMCKQKLEYYQQVVVPQSVPRTTNAPVTEIRSTVSPTP